MDEQVRRRRVRVAGVEARAPLPPPKSPVELATFLLERLLQGADPEAAALGIVEARRAGIGPTDEAVASWGARMVASDASYGSLLQVCRTIEAPPELLRALAEAAAREGEAVPLDEGWTDRIGWEAVPRRVRWELVRTALRDAASGPPGADGGRVLALHLDRVLPTLLPDPVQRLQWWLERAREVSEPGGAEPDLGRHVRAAVRRCFSDAADRPELSTLLQLADVLQRAAPEGGELVEQWLQTTYERIGSALPPRSLRRKRAIDG